MAIDSSTLIPTNNLIDPSKITSIDVKSKEFASFMVDLVNTVNNLMLSVNSKDIGIYNDSEVVTGQLYFNNNSNELRPVYRKVIDFGGLPNNAIKQVAHGLDSTWNYKFTRIYGAASDSTNQEYIPLPYATSVVLESIEVYVDNTNINIRTRIDYTSFDTTYIVLEYLEI